ncbi:low affinity immunoglobulin gamma Fc region receptor III-A-like isoform X1 [Saccopteryx leptura]|uniref:low affinity immunoglobulin gamma Fc region receptor III-A-like isoform X1 n=1 Tax=Saccopteryx leptura TaxID=249018 RepID=UPI00339BEE30
MWQLLPPTALLLLASTDTRADLLKEKAVLSLTPEWDRLLEKDNVTLKCQGARPEGNSPTQWWHNGKLLPHQTSSYFIATATVNDSGEYRCGTNLSEPSDPVLLQVRAGCGLCLPAWLLLQARQWVVQEGEPIVLRCHSWKNIPVYKVQYFRNGRGKKFFYKNAEFHIPKATAEHNGSYFCRGMIGQLNQSSEAVSLTVQALDIPPTWPWLRVTTCLMLGLLFAVDTGLYFSVRRDLRSSLKNRRNDNVMWSKSPEEKQEQ